MQTVLTASADYTELDNYLLQSCAKCIFLVCGSSLGCLRIGAYFDSLEERLNIRVIRFSDFQPNPQYESAVRGAACFRENHCDLIAAVGGGSAMDVAKCIKLFSNMDSESHYLRQKIVPNDVPFLAVPTTAGTGSEATRFAVIYDQGEKQSVSDESCIPSAVLFDADALKTLPLYQKKATMMDAFCHALESFWSVHSTQESRAYAASAIRTVLANMEGYLENSDKGNANMMRAANEAGKAINLTQTTAGHAMCYKLTTLYGIAHGHAAALCNAVLFPYMLAHRELCIDSRGANVLEEAYDGIAAAMNCVSPDHAAARFREIVQMLAMPAPAVKTASDIDMLKTSVNQDRLKNHPVALTEEALEMLYRQILHVK